MTIFGTFITLWVLAPASDGRVTVTKTELAVVAIGALGRWRACLNGHKWHRNFTKGVVLQTWIPGRTGCLAHGLSRAGRGAVLGCVRGTRHDSEDSSMLRCIWGRDFLMTFCQNGWATSRALMSSSEEESDSSLVPSGACPLLRWSEWAVVWPWRNSSFKLDYRLFVAALVRWTLSGSK